MRTYYRMDTLSEEEYVQVDTPVDGDGEPLVSGKGSLAAYACSARTVFPQLTKLTDCIPCLTKELILSVRAARAIEACRMQEGVQFIPGTILAKDGGPIADYVQVVFPKIAEVLDMESSEFEYYRGIDVPIHVMSPVLDRKLVPDCDLFTALYLGCVGSDRLKQTIEIGGFDNFAFEEVPMGG